MTLRMNSPLAIGLAWLAALALSISTALGADDDLARELPRIPPKDGEAALKSFKIHEGFHVEPIAVEPLVTDPVSVCYDADGRLYVVEMRGYPYPENSPSGNVTLLEDRDGDGRFDRSTIFVDGLSWPTGIVPYDGGVFIAVVPDIIYAKDTDGDGKADVRKVIFTGFGGQNVQALLNGLLWGSDGWIYGVAGGNGGEIKNMVHPEAKPVSVRGRDFRFKPDASVFEAASGGGQFGHSFDDWGHRFTCNNSNHIRQIVLPSHYLERNPALAVPAVVDDIPAEGPAAPVYRISSAEPWRIVRTRQRAADPELRKKLPPTELVATGFFTSATGVTIYRGTAYPPEYRGNAFIGDVGGNLVHRKIMSKNGAEFRATRADKNVEFLASTDNWFRPVNFANTPNGTLLIVDMYRETIEHPFSIPEPIKKHLDLTSGKDRGRLYELLYEGTKRRAKPALSKASTTELVKTLADPDAWWRETAQRLLIERKDPAAIPLLKQLVEQRPNALARVHALCTLDVLGALEADDLKRLIDSPVSPYDADPGVREVVARLAERLKSDRVLWMRLVLDNDPMVRFQLALSCGGIDDGTAFGPLWVIAMRDAGDRWSRQAVMSSLRGSRASTLFDYLYTMKDFLDTAPGNVWIGDLSTLIGAANRADDVEASLGLIADFSKTHPPNARSVAGIRGVLTEPDEAARRKRLSAFLLGLGRGLQRSGGSLRSVLQGSASKSIAPLFEQAKRVAKSDAAIDERLDAVRLLGLGPAAGALETLPDLLDARQPTNVQLAAVQALASLSDPQVGPSLIGHWKALSPSVRREGVEALFARPERVTALLDAIERKLVPASDVDPARRKQLLSSTNAKIKERAAKLFAGDPSADRGRVIESFRKALSLDGQREPGRAVFKKACSTCHKAEGEGNEVGPNLATITGRTPEDLLIHILDPNREVPPQYVNYNVATLDGRVVTGMIAEEAANSVTLKRAEGATDVIPRNRIEEIASTGLSLMPEGLEKGLEPQDFANLISFLRGLQGTPAKAPNR